MTAGACRSKPAGAGVGFAALPEAGPAAAPLRAGARLARAPAGSVSGGAPVTASVPAGMLPGDPAQRSMVRTILGVIISTISLRSACLDSFENRRPRTGSLPRPGIRCALRRSLSEIRPAST